MKTKAFLILASVLLAPVSTSLSAEEKITGAFGVKLGQVLSSQMIKTSELAFTHEGDDRYSFDPDKKFRSFAFYTIEITPKTRKIYSIFATGSMDDESTCEKEQALIMALLKQKYGEMIVRGELSSIKGIAQGYRRVLTMCSGLFDVRLSINYLDSNLAKLAENERIALESSNVDSSGL